MAAKDGSIRWFDDWHEFLKSDAAKDIASRFTAELESVQGVPDHERIVEEKDPMEGYVLGPSVDYTQYDYDAVHLPNGSVLLMVNLPAEQAEGFVHAWTAYAQTQNQTAAEMLDGFVGQLAEAVGNARSTD